MKVRSNRSAHAQDTRSVDVLQLVHKRIFLILISILCAVFVSGAPANAETLTQEQAELSSLEQVDMFAATTDSDTAFILQPFERSSSLLLAFGEPYGEDLKSHTGIDIAGTAGEPVIAGTVGTISYVGRTVGATSSDVNCITITDNAGNKVTYRPLEPSVKVGEIVKQGQVIGSLLESGDPSSTTTHLNMSVRDVSAGYVDPWPLLIPFSSPVEEPAESAERVPVLTTVPVEVVVPVETSVLVQDRASTTLISETPPEITDPIATESQIVVKVAEIEALTAGDPVSELTMDEMVFTQEIVPDLGAAALRRPAVGEIPPVMDGSATEGSAAVMSVPQDPLKASAGQTANGPAPVQEQTRVSEHASSSITPSPNGSSVLVHRADGADLAPAKSEQISSATSNSDAKRAISNRAIGVHWVEVIGLISFLALLGLIIHPKSAPFRAIEQVVLRMQTSSVLAHPLTVRG